MKEEIPGTLPFAALTVEQASRLIGNLITKEFHDSQPAEPPRPRNDVMNIAAAVEFLSEHGDPIRKGSLYNLVAAKSIPHSKIGKRLIFRHSELTQWIAAKTHPEKSASEAALLIAQTALRQMKKGARR